MFRTELTIAPQERLLPRTARVLTVGSCFADSIGERLRLNKVSALVNPFGTVFQPLALAQLLRAAAGEEQDWQQHLVEARGRWQSYDFHSTIGAESPVELLQTIRETVGRVSEFVRTADTVVLTLGTAWAYRLRETGELVSNLHKLPASLFEKELLTADEIVNGLAEVHALLRRVNPEIRIVLTVSPVRHIKDTLQLNAVSKSVLRVACHYLSELLPNVSYFPAYELLTDDLRDYRFYAADMLHPSEVAEDYIWERFARTYFDADFGRFRKEWAAVRQSLGHRPLHIGAPEHRTFLDQTRERLERLSTQGVDVRQELRDVQRQLVALPPPRPTRLPEADLMDDDEERIDIGDGTTEPITNKNSLAERPASTEARNERRSDNRRDNNRRNDRSGRDRRDNRSAPIVETTSPEVAPAEEVVSEEPVVTLVSAANEPETAVLAQEEASDYPAKKKKRRSRGGAKRTARKNAARLAAGQETDEIDATGFEDGDVEEQTDLEVIEAIDSVPTQDFAEAAQGAELAAETTIVDVPTSLPEAADPNAQPNQTRKRGTGPTPKKSKVITKSGLVKRGQRGSLYRTAAPAPDDTTSSTQASAPIISPPIIPEILLERPANDFADFPQPTAEPDLAATVLGLYSTKPKAPVAPPQPKRGRPKAAAPPVDAPASPEPVAPTAPEPAEAPVTETPIEAAPADTTDAAPAKAATKKPATRSAKATKPAAAKKTTTAAKPAAPKKAAAKPAATRRGRPPGKTSPPEAETPTT